jgi:hypothetical protein
MVRMVIIYLLFFSSYCVAQVQHCDIFHVDQSDENYSVVEFVKSHIGKKVGNGMCMTLVTEAYKTKYSNWTYDKLYDHDTLIKHEITFDNAQPGDIIRFVYPFPQPSHIGIITAVVGNIIWYANQNSGFDNMPKMEVEDQGEKSEVFINSRVCYEMIDVTKRGNTDIWLFRF